MSLGCPDIVALERFCRGTLDPGANAALQQHVGCCAGCRERADDIRANLQLERPLRRLFDRHAAGDAPHSLGSIAGYRVIREIGRGGMGAVYLAEQLHPRREVAIKVLLPEPSAASTRERFAREADLLAQLRHGGIAQIYEAGIAEDLPGAPFAGRAYIAMEYVAGLPLDRYLATTTLSVRDKALLLARICDAVHHAHANAVIHRDLKPSNILIVAPDDAEPDAGPQPKVLDFGVARNTAPDVHALTLRTEIGQLIGTIPYMSPEQVGGDPARLDARSDVYALGVIGYEMFSGGLPYPLDPGSVAAAIDAIRNADPVPLARRDPALRGDVDAIVAMALRKDITQRYQSAAELAADLRRFLDDQPIAACAPTAWTQLRKFTRRNRSLVAAGVLLAASLVAGTGVALWQARAAQRRLIVARESMDFILYGLGNRHARVFGGTRLNRDLLEQVFTYYKRISDEAPDDRVLRSRLWSSQHSWAQAVVQTGDRERALAMLLDARGRAERALADAPDPALLQSQVARIDFSLAVVFAEMGALGDARVRMTDARAVFAGARAVFDGAPIFEQYEKPYDADFEYARKMAQIERHIGDILLAGWQVSEAQDHYVAAQAHTDHLARATDVPLYGLREPALLLIERGRLAVLTGHFEQTVSLQRRALAALEQALETDRDDPVYAIPLARASHELARTLVLAGDAPSALVAAHRAADLHRRLVDADEVHVGYRRALGESLALCAVAAARADDAARAATAADRARAVARDLMAGPHAGPPEHLTAARLLLLCGTDDAHRRQAVDAARAGRDQLHVAVVEYDVTLAVAQAMAGDRPAALQELAGVAHRIPPDATWLRQRVADLAVALRADAPVDPTVLLVWR